jgi:hypothetical protein
VVRDTLQFLLQSSTICLGSLKNSNTLKTGASAAIVLRKMYVTRQLVNAANVNLDSLETFVNQCASAAIVSRKMYVTRQLVNADYVNLVLVDTSAQVNNDSLWK